MLTCQEMTELVTDFLEGRMPLGQRLAFRMHIGMCAHCRTYLAQMKTTVRTVGHLPEDFSVPSDVQAQLMAQFQRARPASAVRAKPTLSITAAALAMFDQYFGGRRGVAVVASVVGSLGAMTLALGHEGPLLGPSECMRIETLAVLGSAITAALLLGAASAKSKLHVSTPAYASVSMLSTLPWYVALHHGCPLAEVVPHALVFHVGSVLLGAMLGAAVAQLPQHR